MMSKRNSTQQGILAGLFDRWTAFCIKRPQAVVTCTVLFALAGFIAAWSLWFGYESPVSRLPRNHHDRLAWEETSRAVQFNSEIFLRVTVSESLPAGSLSAEQTIDHAENSTNDERLEKAVDLLKHKLSGSKKHFCDILSTRDLQVRESKQLYELPLDDLQMLHAELLDARTVLSGRWSLLETANYAEWLTNRLQENQENPTQIPETRPTPGEIQNGSTGILLHDATKTTLLQNRRLLEAADLFTQGLCLYLSGNVSQTQPVVTPWQLNPDHLCDKTDSQRDNVFAKPLAANESNTVVIWAKLSEPQLSNLLDRRVVGKTKKIDRRMFKKLDEAMSELERIIDDVSRKCADVEIKAFGVPVDVYQTRPLAVGAYLPGCLVMLLVLGLFFVAGIGHVRVFVAVLVSTLSALGVYLGFCAIWFEMVKAQTFLVGIFVLLLGLCIGVMYAVAFQNARYNGRSVSEAVIRMMQTAGKSVLRGNLAAFVVFLAGIFYLWFFPVDPTAATLSFRGSLTGICLVLFLILQGILACMIVALGALPAMIRIFEPECRMIGRRPATSTSRPRHFTLVKTVPSIPLKATTALIVVLIVVFAYSIMHFPSNKKQRNHFVTQGEKQAATLPVLVTLPVFMPDDSAVIPGILACDASRIMAGNDASKTVLLDNMLRTASYSSDQQKITLPPPTALQQAMLELHTQLSKQHAMLAKSSATRNDSKSSEWELILCGDICKRIEQIARLLPQLSQAEYCERIDAYQQAVASDLVVQQKRLQTRLHHSRYSVKSESQSVSRRFRNENRQPLLWLFPTQSWQSIAQSDQSQASVIDIFLAQKSRWKTRPGDPHLQCSGFPLLVLLGNDWSKKQLPSLLAVLAVAVLVLVIVVSRSISVGVMTVSTLICAAAAYGLALIVTDIPFGPAAMLPIAIFPLFLLVFLDIFYRNADNSRLHLQSDFSVVLICFGVGIVIVGQLLLPRDPALYVTGRALAIGWTVFMFSLLLNLATAFKSETTKQSERTIVSAKTSTVTARSAQTVEQAMPAQADTVPVDEIPTDVAPPAVAECMTSESDVQYERRFESRQQNLTTKEQLDYYRERIEATGVFERNKDEIVTPMSDPQAPGFPSSTNSDPHSPEFPSVWSIGTDRRPMQSIVIEQPTESRGFKLGDSSSQAVSCGKATHRQEKRIVLKARIPQSDSPTHRQPLPLDLHEDRFADDAPTILPMHRHVECAPEHVAGNTETHVVPAERRRHG